MTVEEDLRKIQNALRTARPEFGSEESVEGLRVTDPATGNSVLVALRASESALIRQIREALEGDMRFEYLKKPEVQIAEFVADCVFRSKEASTNAFVATYAREPATRICYLPIESLKVVETLEVLGLTLLPPDDVSLPPAELLFDVRVPAGSVAKVSVVGADVTRMVERAREEVNHALRRMRVAFRAERALSERQLRFRLGTTYVLDDGDVAGIRTREDIPWGLEVNQYLADLAAGQSIASAPAIPLTDIQRRIDVAIRWMERATFEPDRLLGILFLFFALESLIGEKTGELKAGALSFRQMMLSHIVDARFTNPITTFDLYQVTRSDTVHGEAISAVDESRYDQFSNVMLRTLEQYMEIANREGFTKRKQLRKYLDEHPDRALLIKWVMDRGSIPEFEKQYKDLVEYVESLVPSKAETPPTST
jgi:hypothetical protein